MQRMNKYTRRPWPPSACLDAHFRISRRVRVKKHYRIIRYDDLSLADIKTYADGSNKSSYIMDALQEL
jgi:hypothetical protein